MFRLLALAVILVVIGNDTLAGLSYESMSMNYCNERANKYGSKQWSSIWHKCTEAENMAKSRLSNRQSSQRVNKTCTSLATQSSTTFSFAAFENCINMMR